jgi:hypothetical protein
MSDVLLSKDHFSKPPVEAHIIREPVKGVPTQMLVKTYESEISLPLRILAIAAIPLSLGLALFSTDVRKAVRGIKQVHIKSRINSDSNEWAINEALTVTKTDRIANEKLLFSKKKEAGSFLERYQNIKEHEARTGNLYEYQTNHRNILYKNLKSDIKKCLINYPETPFPQELDPLITEALLTLKEDESGYTPESVESVVRHLDLMPDETRARKILADAYHALSIKNDPGIKVLEDYYNSRFP